MKQNLKIISRIILQLKKFNKIKKYIYTYIFYLFSIRFYTTCNKLQADRRAIKSIIMLYR